MSGHYKTYHPDQLFHLSPSVKEWSPESYLAYFVSDVVDEIDLGGMEKTYSTRPQGQPPYYPAMMVRLLFYAYCIGIPSSRKIEKETYEDIAFRILTTSHHPDPESRIIKDSTTKGFIQGYNARDAVDAFSQVVVAAEVTIQAHDKSQLEPMLAGVKENCTVVSKELSADACYYSEENSAHAQPNGIRPLIPPGITRHADAQPASPRGRIPKHLSVKERMERLLRTKKRRKAYGKRKETVEPVFGWINGVRGFRQFLLRGLDGVKGEWQRICLTHNLLKRYRWRLVQATA